jgi:hypothetical protein
VSAAHRLTSTGSHAYYAGQAANTLQARSRRGLPEFAIYSLMPRNIKGRVALRKMIY